MAVSCHDEINMEVKIGYVAAILFKHRPVAVHTEQAPVVNHIGGHEIAELFPGTGVQAGDVSLVHVGCGTFHMPTLQFFVSEWQA